MVCRRRHQREVTKRLRDGERADHTDEPAALRYDAARGGVSADRDYSRARPDEGTARPARP